ncbi:MAG: carbohydrate kinase family protein [Lachnospiraceae bacterium]|nr:carbohydrate kinase family protein [Lachnospiraceae bacterium]
MDRAIVCIGSAVMDIMGYPIDQKKEWKEKQRVSDIRILPGGDAVNQSIYMAKLGMRPMLAACVGDDTNGTLLKSALKDMGVDTGFVKEKAGHATGTAMVLVSEDGERRIFSVKGAHSTLSRSDVPAISELPKECRAISLASLFSMPEFEADGLLEYLKEARARGILVFADLAADKLGLGLEGIRAFLPYINYFLPSLYDVLSMTGTETAEEAAEVFHQLGVPNVIIKCGEKGCYCSTNHSWIPAIPVKTVDTTGAGDCMAAVFAVRILSGDSIDAACRYACAAASYSTLFAGASTADLSDETAFLNAWPESK